MWLFTLFAISKWFVHRSTGNWKKKLLCIKIWFCLKIHFFEYSLFGMWKYQIWRVSSVKCPWQTACLTKGYTDVKTHCLTLFTEHFLDNGWFYVVRVMLFKREMLDKTQKDRWNDDQTIIRCFSCKAVWIAFARQLLYWCSMGNWPPRPAEYTWVFPASTNQQNDCTAACLILPVLQNIMSQLPYKCATWWILPVIYTWFF